MRRRVKNTVWAVCVVVAGVLCLAGCGGSDDKSAGDTWPALESLQAMNVDEITSISYARITEGGMAQNTVSDKTPKEEIYQRLCEVKLLEKTDMAVLDDSLNLTVECGQTTLKFSFEGDILVQEDGSRYEVEGLESLKSFIDQMEDARYEETNTAEQDANAGQSQEGNYNILKDLEKKDEGSAMYIYGKDYLLIMPNNNKWDIDQKSPNSFRVYLKAAKESGCEGDLVEIVAYNLDDRSYEELPSYRVAGVGKNVKKRFVALFPTDVRYDTNDAAQVADYKELSDYVHKIGEGAVNSPFQTEDSD